METEAKLFYHDRELLNRAVDWLSEPPTTIVRDDLEICWNRGYGTAECGDKE